MIPKKINISTFEELDLCLKHGINPLFWNRFIKLEIGFRIEVQNRLFGKSELGKVDVLKANDKFYHYCFEHSTLHCENCGQKVYKLRNIEGCYSAIYISHILTRGSNPNIAHDPRNHNFLCPKCHDKWETGNRKEMLIYLDNQIVIKELKQDYCILL